MSTSTVKPRKLTLGKFNVRAEDVPLTQERIDAAVSRYYNRFSRPRWVRHLVHLYELCKPKCREIFRKATDLGRGR